MTDILITEFMADAAVDSLRQGFDVDYDPSLADEQDAIPARLKGARALIVRNRTKVTAELLDAAPSVRCVGRLGVGLDNIDMNGAKERGITVYPALGANNLSVAEYVIENAMVLLRGANNKMAAMLAGEWPRQAASGRELSGKTLGLVGFGSIAQDTARIALALGMKTTAYDPFLPEDSDAWGATQQGSLDEVLACADVLTLHVPLTDGTRHLINADALKRMKSDAFVINTARGGVVDEQALVDAMNAGEIGGAALDVFETEPLTAEAAEKFKGHANLILTPHIAGVTSEANTRVSHMTADLVRRHLQNV